MRRPLAAERETTLSEKVLIIGSGPAAWAAAIYAARANLAPLVYEGQNLQEHYDRGRPPLGIGTEAAFKLIREHVDVMVEDRLVSDDVEKIFNLVRGGMLERAVGSTLATQARSCAE